MIQYDENDVPDKYGFTQKEIDIWELLYADKTLEDGGFEITEEDREYYNGNKIILDAMREFRGHDFRFARYLDDID